MLKNKPVDNLLLEVSGAYSTTIGVIQGVASRPEVNLNAQDDDGNTAIHKITKIGRNLFVECLLNNGANPNIANNQGNTALHIAAEKGDLQIVKLLLKAKAQTFVINNNNLIALELAKQNEHQSIVNLLQMNLNRDLILAMKLSNFQAIDKALAHGADVNAKDDDHNNGLFIALWQNNLKLGYYLIEKGININAYNSELETALSMAVIQKNIDFIRLLINKGANPNYANRKKFTPLHYAIENSNYDSLYTINLLLEAGADPNITPAGDYHFIYKAAYRGYNKIINQIANDLNIINDVNNRDKAPAIQAAAMSGNLDTVHLLVHKGADVSIVSKYKYTAHSIAEKFNHTDISEYLGLRAIKVISASANGKLEIVKALAKKTNVNAYEYHGLSALDMAVNHGHKEVAIYLLDLGAKINTNILGNSVLFNAAKNEDCEMMSILISYGADPYSPNIIGTTALNLTETCYFDDQNI
jgi:ankyrin repeat protein